MSYKLNEMILDYGSLMKRLGSAYYENGRNYAELNNRADYLYSKIIREISILEKKHDGNKKVFTRK